MSVSAAGGVGESVVNESSVGFGSYMTQAVKRKGTPRRVWPSAVAHLGPPSPVTLPFLSDRPLLALVPRPPRLHEYVVVNPHMARPTSALPPSNLPDSGTWPGTSLPCGLNLGKPLGYICSFLTLWPSMKFLGVASLLFFSGVLVAADSSENGMDMSMDGSMNLASGRMVPYLHFTLGDILWFQGWVPTKPGAMFGACFGLFLLAIVERWIAAIRSMAEVYWKRRAQIIAKRELAGAEKDSEKPIKPSISARLSATGVIGSRSALPFIPAHDIPRGILHMGQSALGFAFMLAVMTFQVGFIFSIIIGLGVGEMLFGRYISAAAMH